VRYLFCTLSSYGFIYPAMGIALALRKRGHTVAFVTGQAFGENLSRAGLERIPRGVKDGESFQTELWWQPLLTAIQIKHIEYALEQFSPDLLISSQLANGPLICSEKHHLPVVVLGLAAYLWPLWGPEHRPQTAVEERLEWRYKSMMEKYNEARALFSLPASDSHHLKTPLLGDLFLLQSVPELEVNSLSLPPRARFVGGCLWEPEWEDAELDDWLAATHDAPIIYVQPGRSFDKPGYWRLLIEALGDRAVRIIADIGRMDKEAGPIPKNFFMRTHIPQSKVLPHARALISNGHTTSVLGALTHGLPSLLLPSGSGSEEIAGNCVRAGAAICLSPEEINLQTLERAITSLLDDLQLYENAQKIKQAFSRFDGCERAAELLEEFIPIPDLQVFASRRG
jgi:MGT family glycosyltransferase